MNWETMYKNQCMGNLGERLVANYYNGQGAGVMFSEDMYDSQKDLIINGVTNVEVKTQVPYYTKNLLTVKQNQLNKCLNVDILLFVVVPLRGYDNENARLMEPMDRSNYVEYGKDFGSMVGWNMNNMLTIETYGDMVTKQLQDLYVRE